jgi:glyoxylase I family protein
MTVVETLPDTKEQPAHGGLDRRGFLRGMAIGAGTTSIASLLLSQEAGAASSAAQTPATPKKGLAKGVLGIHHISITVPDMQKALSFYCDLLGFEKVMHLEHNENSPNNGGSELTPEMIAQFKLIHQIEPAMKVDIAVAMVRANTILIEFWEFKNPKVIPQDPTQSTHHGGLMHIALDIADLDALYPQLVAAGVRFHAPPQHSSAAITTYGRDPFGNIIEFQQLPKASMVPR